MELAATTECHAMLYAVTEQTWSISPWDKERKLLRSSGTAFVGDKNAAHEYAEKRATEFVDHYDYQGDAHRPYWWGRKEGERENHRFVIQPVC
jgi:hypothetical protein